MLVVFFFLVNERLTQHETEQCSNNDKGFVINECSAWGYQCEYTSPKHAVTKDPMTTDQFSQSATPNSQKKKINSIQSNANWIIESNDSKKKKCSKKKTTTQHL